MTSDVTSFSRGSKFGAGSKDAPSHRGPSYQVSRSGVFKNLRNYDFIKITWPVMSHLSVMGLIWRCGQKTPQVIEVLATKFQDLGCFRTWEITILVKSRDHWRHASQQGVQRVGAGSKVSSCPSSPTYQVWWRMDFYMLRYLHFLAKIAHFPFVLAPLNVMAGIAPKSSIIYVCMYLL